MFNTTQLPWPTNPGFNNHRVSVQVTCPCSIQHNSPTNPGFNNHSATVQVTCPCSIQHNPPTNLLMKCALLVSVHDLTLRLYSSTHTHTASLAQPASYTEQIRQRKYSTKDIKNETELHRLHADLVILSEILYLDRIVRIGHVRIGCPNGPCPNSFLPRPNFQNLGRGCLLVSFISLLEARGSDGF